MKQETQLEENFTTKFSHFSNYFALVKKFLTGLLIDGKSYSDIIALTSGYLEFLYSYGYQVINFDVSRELKSITQDMRNVLILCLMSRIQCHFKRYIETKYIENLLGD